MYVVLEFPSSYPRHGGMSRGICITVYFCDAFNSSLLIISQRYNTGRLPCDSGCSTVSASRITNNQALIIFRKNYQVPINTINHALSTMPAPFTSRSPCRRFNYRYVILAFSSCSFIVTNDSINTSQTSTLPHLRISALQPTATGQERHLSASAIAKTGLKSLVGRNAEMENAARLASRRIVALQTQ